MSAVKHTPGPWRAEASDMDAMVFTGEDTLIADLSPAFAQGELIEDTEVLAANAKLIAAAPALADALVLMRSRVAPLIVNPHAPMEVIKMARADLATIDDALSAAGRMP